MRKLIIASLLVMALSGHVQAAVVHDSPELPIRFFNAIPDVCFQTARGHPPTIGNAAALLLEPATDVPSTVMAHFSHVTNWFRLTTQPHSIFVGVGDKPNACHVVLANSKQTKDVQNKVIGLLRLGGFQTVRSSAPSAPITDMLFYKEAPDGLMFISLQAPTETVREGEGDQGAVHVNLISKTMMEALTSKH